VLPLLAFLVLASSVSAVDNSGLISWWTMDTNQTNSTDNSITALPGDIMGDSNTVLNGTFKAAVGINFTGIVGEAYDFSADNRNVDVDEVPNHTYNLSTNINLSINVWVNFTGGQDIGAGIVHKGSGNNLWGITTGSNPDFISAVYRAGGAANVEYNESLADGLWHMITYVLDRSAENLSLYVDGVFVNSTVDSEYGKQ